MTTTKRIFCVQTKRVQKDQRMTIGMSPLELDLIKTMRKFKLECDINQYSIQF